MDRRTWREQYDRMKRWHVRVAESSGVDERRVDDFYAFFTCCFHLKDWLKADTTVAQPVGVGAESLFDAETGLRWFQVCADLVNGSKHLVIDRTVRVDPSTRLGEAGGVFDPRVFDSRGFDVGMICVYADGGAWDALGLANTCVGLWDTFLRNWDLLDNAT